MADTMKLNWHRHKWVEIVLNGRKMRVCSCDLKQKWHRGRNRWITETQK